MTFLLGLAAALCTAVYAAVVTYVIVAAASPIATVALAPGRASALVETTEPRRTRAP